MRRLKIMALVSAVLLAACGGKTLTGATGTGTGAQPPVAKITVVTSVAQIAADGSNSATIKATALDANNAAVKGATVSFGASTGAVVAVTQPTTDINGLATATLTNGTAAAGTNITVTASVAAGASGNVIVAVVNIQQTITLTTSQPQIPSDGSKGAKITAVVVNASNQVLPGVLVQFVPSSGNVTVDPVTNGVTDANGTTSATLNVGSDKTNRRITVTATAGSATATVGVDVVGTKITIVGSPSLVLGNKGFYTISLTDSSNAGISGATVTVASAAGNTLSAPTLVTDSSGQGTVTVTATKPGNDTLTASALGLSNVQAVSISNQSFQFTTPTTPTPPATQTKVNLGVNQTLTVNWTNGGAAQVGKTINFSATRGTLSSPTAVTDPSGNATVTISSTIAGPAAVTASATGVSAQIDLDFIATTPSNIDVQVSPATIPTQGTSIVTATVRDAQNNLVEGQTVNFKTVNDITGGSLSVAAVVTDAQGRAQSKYTASTTPSASNGVTIQATVQGTAITQTAKLTVGGLSVFLSLGTGNKISENATQTEFIVPYSVLALDAGGNPVANVAITLTVHPLYYSKGTYVAPVGATRWQQQINATCPNEDANFNGVLDPGEDGLMTDAGLPTFNAFGNKNGKLDPGGTALASPSTVVTGTNGSADFSVIYPEDQADWVQVDLIATSTVSGTETTADLVFVLPMLAAYITNLQADPPGRPSPYGVAALCTDPN